MGKLRLGRQELFQFQLVRILVLEYWQQPRTPSTSIFFQLA
jgi:hypothetical protein